MGEGDKRRFFLSLEIGTEMIYFIDILATALISDYYYY